ncbi:MAG: nucleotidyltransferase family protein [Bacteroidales bacterium]|jgi:predicted nucleotidyltransferase|nr:nucleotidyltransferase family protein [Bacteroidales bacterium]
MSVYLENTIQSLQRLKPLLTDKYHIKNIGLFGSVVRDDFSADNSDVDILVDFTKPIGIEFIDLSNLLEKELGRSVDVVSRNGIKEKYYKEIEKEIAYV